MFVLFVDLTVLTFRSKQKPKNSDVKPKITSLLIYEYFVCYLNSPRLPFIERCIIITFTTRQVLRSSITGFTYAFQSNKDKRKYYYDKVTQVSFTNFARYLDRSYPNY